MENEDIYYAEFRHTQRETEISENLIEFSLKKKRNSF